MSDTDIQYYHNLINKNLLDIYSNGPQSIVEPINYILIGGGKRLRPILTLLTTIACGKDAKIALPSAVAIEILHNFTLVHDDIMDNDHIRHGHPTVHSKWDVGTAILTGDAMVSLAFKELGKTTCETRIQQIEAFIDGLLRVCEGQALDKEFETKQSVNVKEYIQMIDLKTGYLLGLSAELGALSAGANYDCIIRLRDYGRLIGRAFQIQDDLLEIFSDTFNMGKSLESDIILGKKTYLIIQALENDSLAIQDAIKVAKSDFQKGIALIRDILIQSRIKEKTETYILSIIKEANGLLQNKYINSETLSFFSKLILNRGH